MEEYPSCKTIAEASLNKFLNLLGNSENQMEQWSVLSTVVQYNKTTKKSKVVALGTGTKCIGVDRMCPDGTILNDSHAEVMCRRSFIRYIYNHMLNQSKILQFNAPNSCFLLNPDISFHFFSTHPPCGDATIVENYEKENDSGIPSKKVKHDNDYVCTGAKLLGVVKGIDSETGEKTDPLDQDENALRTKPGRGIRTLSMSCSDKLSKWNILGVQGALLDLLLDQPIYFKTLNFCCETELKSIERAVFNRWKSKTFINDRFKPQRPYIRIKQDFQFNLAKLDDKKPSARSISWCDIPEKEKPLETAVNGKKEGVTKKALQKNPSSGVLQITKVMYLKSFAQVIDRYPVLNEKLFTGNETKDEISYKELKDLSKCYQKSWNILKSDYFEKWTIKPDNLLDFKIKL